MKQYENQLYQQGYKLIAGCDECGRGCIAGPLVVACCILPVDYNDIKIKDSKKLNINQRKELANQIKKVAIDYSIKIYWSDVVDKYNPKQTSIKGMLECIKELKIIPDYVITDYERLKDLKIKQLNLVKGDAKSISVAAASILAKAIRDELMLELHTKYPEYDFIHNQGYLNKTLKQKYINQELKFINKVHRKTYEPFKSMFKIKQK